jgi:hypothetical protein
MISTTDKVIGGIRANFTAFFALIYLLMLLLQLRSKESHAGSSCESDTTALILAYMGFAGKFAPPSTTCAIETWRWAVSIALLLICVYRLFARG